MNPELRGIWEHMRELGLGALAHANRHAAYIAMENPRWDELSVLQAAHAAELLIKARIAQEHPLLIFEQLPRSTQTTNPRLGLEELFKQGRTLQWNELPERLWAATGTTLPSKALFDEFGKLRNGIQHFGPPPAERDASKETLRFVFGVIDPFIFNEWGLFAIDHDEDHEPYTYFVGALAKHEIEFIVSPECAASFEHWDVDWSSVSEPYRREMHSRVEAALAKTR
ncbi:MAG TPA: hypothetical protein VFS43_04750 [Polyangiaceae bacterium]|nr:hypothetical protein [Polyangiaceae bacterium]